MKTKIALLAGGYTGEAEVSYRSAAFVAKNIDPLLFEVYLIIITKEQWFYKDQNDVLYTINKEDFSITIEGEKVVFDLAFIMIHGSPGEDGLLQGYFDMIDIPYTSCGTLTSALSMHKAYTKGILRDIPDINLASSVLLSADEQEYGANKIIGKLKTPYFVKPNAGGSSIGMSKVTKEEDLQKAIDLAFNTINTGKEVIVEEFVEGREFTIGVYRTKGELVVLPATEIIPKNEFFDFEAKYTPGVTEEITPADLNEEQKQRIDKIIRSIYEELNCKGMVRIDFFIEENSDLFYFIELNTIPGQTETSFIPQQVRAYGKTEKEFYTEIIQEALRS
ncbi:MAG TPA: D-alanine--D-alanine ligase [Sphingobacteriaceae bacterium]|nr:D-alanine--D-alanine ligase [Sphingobacteriaceae bacterium]